MIVRIFDTAVDPDDLERGIEIFLQDVKPAFDKFEGCHGIEWLRGLEEHSGDLIDVTAVSRWESMEAIEKAMAGEDYEAALANLRKLFQQTPIVRHFDVMG